MTALGEGGGGGGGQGTFSRCLCNGVCVASVCVGVVSAREKW